MMNTLVMCCKYIGPVLPVKYPVTHTRHAPVPEEQMEGMNFLVIYSPRPKSTNSLVII